MVEGEILYSMVFDSRTKIVVEYEVEVASSASSPGLAQAPKATKWRRLDWERENEEMLELARNGAYKIPTHLIIRGTVLDMRLKWQDGEKNDDASWQEKVGKWTVMKGEELSFPWRGLLEDPESEGRTTLSSAEVVAFLKAAAANNIDVLDEPQFGVRGWVQDDQDGGGLDLTCVPR
ncbi:hypothetical protein QBC45DRAFT_444936 [Copromyces sp. CBS 386.78]|nr:hypothetical protein QBC45DRAFT_444936 [Copromyces sp. CBS 386.78]